MLSESRLRGIDCATSCLDFGHAGHSSANLDGAARLAVFDRVRHSEMLGISAQLDMSAMFHSGD